jgi:hypothetical protein
MRFAATSISQFDHHDGGAPLFEGTLSSIEMRITLRRKLEVAVLEGNRPDDGVCSTVAPIRCLRSHAPKARSGG